MNLAPSSKTAVDKEIGEKMKRIIIDMALSTKTSKAGAKEIRRTIPVSQLKK